MKTQRWTFTAAMAFALALALLSGPGCNGGLHKRRALVAEPPLGSEVVGPGMVSSRPVTFVDNHPLMYKPREWYEKTESNGLVKTGAAVVVGVPAGVLGEVKQIVVGRPTTTAPY